MLTNCAIIAISPDAVFCGHYSVIRACDRSDGVGEAVANFQTNQIGASNGGERPKSRLRDESRTPG